MNNSLVVPYFTYCSTIWHGNNNLFKLQKRAAQVITNSDYVIKSIQIFETLQWQTMKTILDKQELKMMFKILKGMALNCLKIYRVYKKNAIHILCLIISKVLKLIGQVWTCFQQRSFLFRTICHSYFFLQVATTQCQI